MTTRAEMQALREASRQIVAALRDIGATDVADRLERCALARSHRIIGRRHWTCRSAGCPWCCRPLGTRWLTTLLDRTGDGTDVSTVIVPLAPTEGDLRSIVRTFRRTLRDLRDRAGRRRRNWRRLSAAGMLIPGGTGRVVLLRVQHAGLARSEVAAFFNHRWPHSTISAALSVPRIPAADMPLADRISLALLRRGIEPLRIALAPQGERSSRLRHRPLPIVEPMPLLF